MTYGYRRPPWGIRACLSHDCGRTWDIDNEIVIRMDGGTPDGQKRKVGDSDLGYPVSVQLDDSTIFTVLGAARWVGGQAGRVRPTGIASNCGQDPPCETRLR